MIEFVFIGLLGLCVGSFCNVLIARIPHNQSIVTPRSHCPRCKAQIVWYDNIPLVSFFLLQAKCRFCQSAISYRYPLVELIVGLLFVFVFYKNGINLESLSMSLCFALLVTLSSIDTQFKAVPDSLNLCALFFALVAFSYPYEAIENLHYALVFAGFFAILRFVVSYFKKQEAMGEADILIAATMGAILHLKLTFVAIFLAAIFGLVGFALIKNKDAQMPFIPFLTLSLICVYFFDTYVNFLLELLYG